MPIDANPMAHLVGCSPDLKAALRAEPSTPQGEAMFKGAAGISPAGNDDERSFGQEASGTCLDSSRRRTCPGSHWSARITDCTTGSRSTSSSGGSMPPCA